MERREEGNIMKKSALLLILLLTMVLAGCEQNTDNEPNDNNGNNPTEYVVSFETNGGTIIESITVNADATLQLPSEPTKSGYDFGGWFIDSNFTTIFDETYTLTEDITVYAKWNSTCEGFNYEDDCIIPDLTSSYALHFQQLPRL